MPAARGNRRLMDGTNGTNRTDGTNKIRWDLRSALFVRL
jgi:hypothetical protein